MCFPSVSSVIHRLFHFQVIKFGLKHVTTLIEEQKASLVVIAHDVNPIELVVWLPALCRKMGVPYCIMKGKVCSRGEATGTRTTAVNEATMGDAFLLSVFGSTRSVSALQIRGAGIHKVKHSL